MFFFFKQKTAYEMRISDWSSDVCSSDLFPHRRLRPRTRPGHRRREPAPGRPRRADRVGKLRQPAGDGGPGSQLTNKYAEGYPGKRYYGGCEYVDVAEQLAIDRVKQLFGAGSAEGMYDNVQPHSGRSAEHTS